MIVTSTDTNTGSSATPAPLPKVGVSSCYYELCQSDYLQRLAGGSQAESVCSTVSSSPVSSSLETSSSVSGISSLVQEAVYIFKMIKGLFECISRPNASTPLVLAEALEIYQKVPEGTLVQVSFKRTISFASDLGPMPITDEVLEVVNAKCGAV